MPVYNHTGQVVSNLDRSIASTGRCSASQLSLTTRWGVRGLEGGDRAVRGRRGRLGRWTWAAAWPAATPPCGDLCFVWAGSQESLHVCSRESEALSKKVR